eukprot:gnl/MRDRNA2_/MRDRNA2_48663_c0_seq1.p1 gnl/MRDRNA2_/MRDRNA2_48663_c0~~gnl/MRDRNA2_/MRDRNA2_48663_c0_seq1.p1  ORF type:complete len:160 (+),score=14.13 gnl/MRDRNA2_/MRDRNA2_48663_c0_seq1:44-481(+)
MFPLAYGSYNRGWSRNLANLLGAHPWLSLACPVRSRMTAVDVHAHVLSKACADKMIKHCIKAMNSNFDQDTPKETIDDPCAEPGCRPEPKLANRKSPVPRHWGLWSTWYYGLPQWVRSTQNVLLGFSMPVYYIFLAFPTFSHYGG